MTFGNPQEFAVEAYHEPSVGNHRTVFGQICFHIRGQVFGDIFDPHCGLWDAIGSLHRMSQNLDHLWHEALQGLTDEQISERLDTALYRDVGQTVEQMREDWNTFGECSFLTNWGESFDKAPKAFIVRPNPGNLRMIWRNEGGQACALEFSEQLFCKVAEQVFQWHEQESAKLPISPSDS